MLYLCGLFVCIMIEYIKGILTDLNPTEAVLEAAEEDEKFILAHADRLRHFHIHDCSLKANHLALGEGGLDTLRYLKMADEKDCTAVIEVKESSALLHSKNYLINHGVW